jgi:GTPase SAR1 family protein
MSRLKVFIMGDAGTGKSSLVRNLCAGAQDFSKSHVSNTTLWHVFSNNETTLTLLG